MFYRSARLLLRPHWAEDWQAIYAGINDEGVVRNLARAQWPYSAEDARSFAAMPINAHTPRFLITLSDSGAVIGCIGLDETGSDDTLELGYWIARPAWGNGYASEAGYAAIEIARMMGKARLQAGFYIDNPASGRVLQKLGFVRQNKTVMRYSLGRDEEVETAELTLDLVGDTREVRKAA